MQRLPQLSDYELFAYIASGFALLVVRDIVVSSHTVLCADWTVLHGVLIVLVSYILGHIIAWPSERCIEQWFTSRILHAPSITLMNRDHSLRNICCWKRVLFRGYYTPLNDHLRSKVDARNTRNLEGESLFWSAFIVAKRDENAYSRMFSFLKLYGFCRNMAFVAILGGFSIIFDITCDYFFGQTGLLGDQRFKYVAFALLVGYGMLYRYLTFYRLYSLEVFISYASSIQVEGSSEENV